MYKKKTQKQIFFIRYRYKILFKPHRENIKKSHLLIYIPEM